MTQNTLVELAELIESKGITHAKLFVCDNNLVSGKPHDIRIAADCLAVAASLRARASQDEGAE